MVNSTGNSPMTRRYWKPEDLAALILGLGLVALALPAAWGVDLLGWAASVQVWIDPSKLAKTVGAYKEVTPWAALGLTWASWTIVSWLAIRLTRGPLGLRGLLSLGVLLAIILVCWVCGHHALLAATAKDRKALGVSNSLGLTGEAGYLVALGLGLIVGNFFPLVSKRFGDLLRADLWIKPAIVLVGGAVGVKALEQQALASTILVRGLAAIVEAYLIYWALVYLLARVVFRFGKEWAAPLASGISICGVSAAIATGAAIRARPMVAVVVSSMVVVFSVFELVLLPWLAFTLLPNEPMVAAAWMGLAVKTDGAAIAAGAVAESLYDPGKGSLMVATTTTIKVFIDLFIGVWCLVLALVWEKYFPGERTVREGESGKVQWLEIWERFPKFLLGYFFAFGLMITLGLVMPDRMKGFKLVADELDLWRKLFFAAAFFCLGVGANFRVLIASGLGRLTLVYMVAIFGIIIWIALGISWLFFHGVPATLPTSFLGGVI